MYVYTYICLYICVCLNVNICVCIYICVFILSSSLGDNTEISESLSPSIRIIDYSLQFLWTASYVCTDLI